MTKLPLRRISRYVEMDLADHKMVLISGPRQCGKTTLAKNLLGSKDEYYNWDIPTDRRKIREMNFGAKSKMWVFDELHKFPRWRNYLKGLYDEHGKQKQILVTGSAKLEMFARGGDSLQGRYFLQRLHPLTLGELTSSRLPADSSFMDSIFSGEFAGSKTKSDGLLSLLQLGGFPEPFLRAEDRFAKRWRENYATRLVQEDIRDLYRFPDLELVEALYDRLPETVASAVNYNRYAKDLEVAFESVKRWIKSFESLYGIFRIPPYGVPKIRATKKEQKLYLWDWARVNDPGGRLENLVAVHLLRLVHWCHDVLGEKIELRYFRDAAGHEVDFILLKNRLPWVAIEVKSSEQPLENSLKYLLEKVQFPYAFQLSLKSNRELLPQKLGKTKVRMLPIANFIGELP